MLPAIGYDHPDQSHFTSRHYWEVGATDPRLLTGWLGRYLDSIGTPDNPLQGLSLDGSLSPASRRPRCRSRRSTRPDQYDFCDAGRLGHASQNRMLDAIGAARRDPLARPPASRPPANVARQSDRLRRQLLPFAGKKLTPPVTYPTSTDSFPTQLCRASPR